MTEEEWLATTDPTSMLEFLLDKASDRKLRLFAVSCCRRLWDILPEERYRQAVEVVEQYADDLLSEKDVMQARGAISHPPDQDDANVIPVYTLTAAATGYSRSYMARVADYVCYAQSWDGRSIDATKRIDEEIFQADLLHCVFGSLPYRPIALDPSWLTSTAVTLAQRMYETRDFSLMPILADALQDAGCDNTDILDHCRGPGPHVRGCWVVDLLLGKK